MRFLYLVLVVLVLEVSFCSAAKKKSKSKSEVDFEFDEDTMDTSSLKRDGGKKMWIFDPDSELCQALHCRKEERCLLENAYTAVCVSRSEMKRNGDVVVPINDARTSTTTERSLVDDEEDEDYDEDDEDDDIVRSDDKDSINLNENDENNIDDDLALEFYDLDGSDGSESSSKVKTTTSSTTIRSAVLRKCTPCPVIKPSYICGTDNTTYSSICKLDFTNCMHSTSFKVACKGFCPCPSADKLKQDKKAMWLTQFENKYKSTLDAAKENSKTKPKVIFAPDVAKFKKELFGKNKKVNKANVMDLSTDKHRQRGYNDVLPEKKEGSLPAECTESTFNTMGNRLLDWFSVLKGQSGQKKYVKSKAHFSSSCATEVQWMFGKLDANQDNQLSMTELYDLEHNERENCLKPFLDKCDDNRDIFLTSSEWCRCFSKADRPCVAMRRRSKPGLLGAYIPTCDVEGFFHPTQCHSAVGTCWCVDKHGVEQNGSRSRGKPDCEAILLKNGLMNALNDEDDSINQLDESDEMEDGSGDY